MKDTQLLKLNPTDISEQAGFNTRYDLGDLREISTNMENVGFDPSQPLIVREDPENKGKYILGAQGHRRLTVARKLAEDGKLKDGIVYAILEDEGKTDDERNLDILRLNSGEPLPMLAAARVIERAWGDGKQITKRDLGRAIGKTDTFVGDCLKLITTTKQTQKWIEKEKITAYQVVALVNELTDPEKVESAVEKLIAKAEKSGKDKVTKAVKDKAEKEDAETEEEKEAREAKEKEEKEAREAVKSRNKELIAYETRVQKFEKDVVEASTRLNKLVEDKVDVSQFDLAGATFTLSLAGYLTKKHLNMSNELVEANEKEEATKLSEVWAAYRALVKVHNETLKENTKALKEEAKSAVKEVKEEAKANELVLKETLKETKEEAAKRIADAKAKAKAKKD